MNFIEGRVENGRFQAAGIDLPVTGADNQVNATFGFRPEDAEVVAPGDGLFDGRVYTAELTGEQTLVTVELGDTNLAIKMPKDFDVDFDSAVGVRFAAGQGFLFDTLSGSRLGARVAVTT